SGLTAEAGGAGPATKGMSAGGRGVNRKAESFVMRTPRVLGLWGMYGRRKKAKRPGSCHADPAPPRPPAPSDRIVRPGHGATAGQRPAARSDDRAALAGLVEAEAVGDRGGLDPGVNVELGEDVGDVDAGGLGADEQHLGDLAVAA